MGRVAVAAALLVALIAAPAARARAEGAFAGRVDAARVRAADAEPGEWLVHGRTWDEQRHSPLTEVRRDNVAKLGLAWSYLPGTRRGLEATLIVVDGVMYATGTWSVVYALDARTGRELWRYDPQVPRAKGRDACCDAVNRGVAVWKGRVYVGALDGRLIALDAATGKPVWQVQTTDPAKPYTITGAPRVVKDLVVIGNGGAEYGVRGYFSAYDAATGEQRWRFYTVPARKEGPHEQPALELAASTWPADALFESGLGGTVWDSMAYDPELDLLYVGVGNSSVYNRKQRSPGGGDNLFLASILAVRPETGRLVWYYQEVPGEHWDYTATQHIVLVDLPIGGRLRKVLLQAPKDGFFYVLDRATGELLSAEKFVPVSWAERVDLASGRPVERAEAVWDDHAALVTPAIVGAHNWNPMSFDPETGLVFIPAIQMTYDYEPDPGFHFVPGRFNTAEDIAAMSRELEGFEALRLAFCSPARLLAWDPVRQRKVWEVPNGTAVPGGVLSTAGGLVFQGNGTGRFAAYDTRDGRELWGVDVGIGIIAPPVTYRVDGEQYVAVLAGIGGSLGTHFARIDYVNEGRLLAFKLGGAASLPPVEKKPPGKVDAPRLQVSPAELARGRKLYAQHCFWCHGVAAVSGGLHPDLRFASRQVHEQWDAIVLGGTRAERGMASFADLLGPEEAHAIHAYVVSRALAEPSLVQELASWLADHACVPASWLAD